MEKSVVIMMIDELRKIASYRECGDIIHVMIHDEMIGFCQHDLDLVEEFTQALEDTCCSYDYDITSSFQFDDFCVLVEFESSDE